MWQPIKTAPKNADLILWGELLTYCTRDHGEPMGKAVAVGRWRVDRWYSGLYEIVPTHWMNLPEPPAKGSR
jgi:hypothetical protein